MRTVFLIYRAVKFDGSVAVGGDATVPFVVVGAVVLDPELSDGAVETVGGEHRGHANAMLEASLNGFRNVVEDRTPIVSPLTGEVWYEVELPERFQGVPCHKLAGFLLHKYAGHRSDGGEADRLT